MTCVQGYKRSAVKAEGELQERMKAVKLQAEHVMAGIITTLSKEVSERPHLLTQALQRVFAEAPASMTWRSCPKLTGCWVAEVREKTGIFSLNRSHKGHEVFTVNLLTGAALCNGKAPTRLDRRIVEDQVYVAVFGNTDFDVTPKLVGDQVTYRTVHAINGFFYSWQMFGARLLVTETCGEETLELLPCTILNTCCVAFALKV